MKRRSRLPGMIFTDAQAAGGNRTTRQESTAGVPCPSPRSLALGSFQRQGDPPFKQTGAASTEPGIRTEGAPPRGLSRYAPHIQVPQGVLPMNRDRFHPRPRADPVTGQATRGQPGIRAWCQHLRRSFRYGTRPVSSISMRRRRSSDGPRGRRIQRPNPTSPSQSSKGHKA